ncbi:hypothetical protein [Sphingobium algorifonticola]|uniref:Uncharacterized protein n=1 Tax=Sphingobium algorifonticola TaxID=2008318 RepID=A0A437JCF2_9SPHN|nr:hypothetical protein [Sphingobium algorifonticola]RVT43608.1 hypothetical protein ENE74_03065 [Sphingobium algorifonticola]
MLWDRNMSIGCALALVMGTLAAAPLAAETIVVRASGPSAKGFPPGRKLADSGSIALKGGDVVTLLDGRGTRTLRGPGTFSLAATATAGTDSRTSLASLLETKRVRRARTGAVRGGVAEDAAAPRSPNLWYVDISQASTACVPDPANVRLWRPDIASAATVTITATSGGGSAPVAFAAGEAVASWPATLPVTEGARYRLSWNGLARPVDIGFSLMGTDAGGLETMASTLIARKCDAQLALLVETVALPDPAPDAP